MVDIFFLKNILIFILNKENSSNNLNLEKTNNYLE
jgi:hypothetical protein